MTTTTTGRPPVPPGAFSLRCLVGNHAPALRSWTEPGATVKYRELWHDVRCLRCTKLFGLHMQSVLARHGRIVEPVESRIDKREVELPRSITGLSPAPAAPRVEVQVRQKRLEP